MDRVRLTHPAFVYTYSRLGTVVIYSKEPTDWCDLQDKVASILRLCGCASEVEQSIKTARGKVDIDVHAVDPTTSPKLTYLCECKYWSRTIPKTVVHSFRTVVSDYGAHVGFLISRKGFQSGAYEAAQNSNIQLVTWYEFQEIFLDRWKDGRYATLRQEFEELFEFYDYISAPIGNAISGNITRMEEYNFLLKRFSPQADANPWRRMGIGPKQFPLDLPCEAVEISSDGTTTKLIFTDYATLFDWHEKQVRVGLDEFTNFVQKYRTGPVGT